MRVCGLDPGEHPGYCWRSFGAVLTATSAPSQDFDLVCVEGQFQARGKASRNGKLISIHHQSPLTLSFTAGLQAGRLSSGLMLVMTPPVWRGLLWSDGGGAFGLSQEATLNRLKQMGAKGSDDEVMAYGLLLAGELVGFAKKGELRNGTPWKLVKQPGRFEVKAVTARTKARAFVKGLKP